MDPKLANIPVIRSLIDLGEFDEAAVLPLTQMGTTVTMAQQACWVSENHFAVGRWDGSLSVFSETESNLKGPVITMAVSAPADQGVEMVEWIAEHTFISSNDAASMVVWTSPSGTFEDLKVIQTLQYDVSYGVANCATAENIGNTLYVVTGHENGYLLIWSATIEGPTLTSPLSFVLAVDLTSAHPVNPWKLQNIRGVSWLFSNDQSIQVVTGSENGEVCLVDVPSGDVLSRTVFNPSAKRGINAISLAGQNLLVANCSVGSADRNLWYYWIDGNDWSLTLRDSVNLIVDQSRQQAFNFDVSWGWYTGGLCFYSATEEGQLWMGTIENNQSLSIIGNQRVAVADLGAALASGGSSLAYVAYNVAQFQTMPGERKCDPAFARGDPNRLEVR